MSNKFLTVIYDMSRPGMQQKASLLLLEADWTASGWSHAFADRDEARKELYRLQESIAAAPQVVADERELPPLPQYFPSIVNIRADEEVRAQQYAQDYARSALAAAPVQAQEPFAYMIADSDGKPHFDEFCVAGGEFELDAEVSGLNQFDDGRPYTIVPVYRAPVQPVAVPDEEEFGFKAVRLRRTAFLLGLEGAIPDNDKDLMDCMGAVLGMICREVERISAPAAQGDAKKGNGSKDCSGTPASCPDNEGYGCACSAADAAAQSSVAPTTKKTCNNCGGEGRFYKTVMLDFGSGEREETVCKVCVGSGVIYAAIAAKAAS